MQSIVFFVQKAYNIIASRKGLIVWLEIPQTSVSAWTQIKDVFDEELTNWNEVGGEDLPIRLFRLEDITQYYTDAS